jgi:flagellar biosynthetic protein FlhB
MAENENGSEKKHDASERKVREAAERGQIAQSADLGSLAVLVLGGLALVASGVQVAGPIIGLAGHLWSDARRTLTLEDATHLIHQSLAGAAFSLAWPLGAAAFGALAIGLAQGRLRLAPKALEPNLEKLDPISGFQQHFASWTPWVELAKGSAKVALIGGVVVVGLQDEIRDLPALAARDVQGLARVLTELSGEVLLLALPVVVVLAAADYAWSAYKTQEDLRMTDEEARQEHKEQEGDPKYKAARRARQRDLARGSLVAALKTADVVVTNPTHFAVALRYKRGQDHAPIVVAKGTDEMALHIRRLALDAKVPRVEDRPLARALFAQVEVGHPIPEDLYGPVARVLAVVWRQRKRAVSYPAS